MKTDENKTQNDEGTVIAEDQLNTGMDHENESEMSHIQETREKLKALSISVRELVKEGKFQNVNEAILDSYKDDENKEFKSYNQWHEDGYQVRKGEKAFALWGRPKEHEAENDSPEKSEGASDEHMSKFFPIAFVFSNKQVDPIQKRMEEPEKDAMSEIEGIRNGKVHETAEMEK